MIIKDIIAQMVLPKGVQADLLMTHCVVLHVKTPLNLKQMWRTELWAWWILHFALLYLASISMSRSHSVPPCLTFWGCKCHTLLPVAEETDRQRAQQHIKTIWIYRQQFLSKDVISLVLVLMIDVVTYRLTAIGKHFRGRIYLHEEGH